MDSVSPQLPSSQQKGDSEDKSTSPLTRTELSIGKKDVLSHEDILYLKIAMQNAMEYGELITTCTCAN